MKKFLIGIYLFVKVDQPKLSERASQTGGLFVTTMKSEARLSYDMLTSG